MNHLGQLLFAEKKDDRTVMWKKSIAIDMLILYGISKTQQTGCSTHDTLLATFTATRVIGINMSHPNKPWVFG